MVENRGEVATVSSAFSRTFHLQDLTVSYCHHVSCDISASFYATIKFLGLFESRGPCALVYENIFEESLRKISGKSQER